MLGRRKQQDQASTREAERRALFAELAKRPDTVCPLLGLAASRTEYHGEFTREHRCYAFGEPAELSSGQQENVCLQRGYGNCPRYLRGVLVIPTEELEALRQPAVRATPPAPPAAPRPTSRVAAGRDRRTGVMAAALVLVLAAGGGAAFLVLRDDGVAVAPTPTPSATAVSSASAAPSITGSAPPSPVQTPDPTPIPGDVFDFFEVAVVPGTYLLFEVDEETGEVIRQVDATFSANSQAPVERLTLPDGSPYWRTALGFYTGLSYIHDESGPFGIRAVYKRPDGSRSSELLPEDEL